MQHLSGLFLIQMFCEKQISYPNRGKTRLGVISYLLSVNSFERSTAKITPHRRKRYNILI